MQGKFNEINSTLLHPFGSYALNHVHMHAFSGTWVYILTVVQTQTILASLRKINSTLKKMKLQ